MTIARSFARIEERVHHVADQRGDAVAFVCRDEEISYSTLIHRTDALAGMLVDLGLCPGDRTGVLLFKSIDMPVAVYGSLAAGCTYVPLDPLTAASRLENIIQDCAIRVLICDRLSISKALALAVAHDLILIGDDVVRERCADAGVRAVSWADVACAKLSPPCFGSSPADNAYILYTSGSTGTPKGIAHTHASAGAYVDACLDTWDFHAGDHFANHSPLFFDMSTMEFLVAPAVGAKTTLITEDVMKTPASMAALIDEAGISIWYSVPFALMQLLDGGDLDGRDMSSLRRIIFAGEAFPVPRLRALHDALAHVSISNAYGPTETNVCTIFHVDKDDLATLRAVPVGKPWSASVARVESPQGEVCSVYEAGELLIGGGTLMAGYWNRPDLDALSLVERGDPPRGFYRTGDIAHIDTDDVLHLHGRMDRQVKHHGFRIELDEIETALHSHPDVSAASALLWPERDELVAVVCVKPSNDIDLKSVRRLLRGRLPAYAVPSRILVSQALPVSANNKIDRPALIADLDRLERDQVVNKEHIS